MLLPTNLKLTSFFQVLGMFKVVAQCKSGSTVQSDESYFYTTLSHKLCPPGKPIPKSISCDQVTLEWENVSGNSELVIEHYRVTTYTSNSKDVHSLYSKGSGNILTISHLAPCTDYYFTVAVAYQLTSAGRYHCVSDESKKSDRITTKPLAPTVSRTSGSPVASGKPIASCKSVAPSGPGIISSFSRPGKPVAVQVTATSIVVTWEKPFVRVNDYCIVCTSEKKFHSVTTGDEIAHVDGLTPNTTYYVTVTANYGLGISRESEQSDPIITEPLTLFGKVSQIWKH